MEKQLSSTPCGILTNIFIWQTKEKQESPIFLKHIFMLILSADIWISAKPQEPQLYMDLKQRRSSLCILRKMAKHFQLEALQLKYYIHPDIHWNLPAICYK